MSLRIINSEKIDAYIEAKKTGDLWMDRLVKLIPAESLWLYGVGTAFVKNVEHGLTLLFLGGAFITCLIRYFATQNYRNRPQWSVIIISLISYCLWVFALPDAVRPFYFYEQIPIAIIALIYTVIVPIIYKGN